MRNSDLEDMHICISYSKNYQRKEIDETGKSVIAKDTPTVSMLISKHQLTRSYVPQFFPHRVLFILLILTGKVRSRDGIQEFEVEKLKIK